MAIALVVGIASVDASQATVVGAPLDDDGSNSNQGSAYVFQRSGTTWAQQKKLIAGDGAAGGIGTSTLRIAPALGASRVIAVVSTEDKAEVEREVVEKLVAQHRERAAAKK